MTPRRRSRENRDLPDNLHYSPRTRDGQAVRYYYYTHPHTGVRHPMGYDKTEAIAAAKQLNQLLGKGRSLVEKVQGAPKKIVLLGEYVTRLLDVTLAQRRVKGEPLSPAYLAETRRILLLFVDHMGADRIAETITQQEIADYLNELESADAFNQHRARLVMLWKYLVSDGVAAENLPEKIIKRDLGKRVRQRLMLAGYKAIFAKATRAMQVAMEISLNAMQRRADVQKWGYADQRDGHAHVRQQKTWKHGLSSRLRIPLALPVAHSELGCRTLGEIIEVSRADGILCPFVVHQRPQRVKKSQQKQHPFQLSPAEISKGFAEARDACGFFDDIPEDERPTFHELVALGESLRLEQGWTIAEIQQLRGHTSERTTKVYLEGHQEWTTVVIPAPVSR